MLLTISYLPSLLAKDVVKLRTLTGTVLEHPDQEDPATPLQGVKVYVLGDYHYIQTDMNGHYTIKVPEDATQLKFEALGYRNQVVSIQENKSNISLELQRNEDFMEDEGWIITIVGMGVVYTSLILLFVIFNTLPLLLSIKRKPSIAVTPSGNVTAIDPKAVTGEVAAAIAAAVHSYLDDIHDHENTILTIDRTAKNYSPWSSKIYVTHQLRKF